MHDIMNFRREAVATDVLAAPAVCSDAMLRCLFRKTSIAAMMIYGFYQIAMAPWFLATASQSITASQIFGLMFALLATLFLGLSRSQPLLRVMSRLSARLSAGEVGQIYLAMGSTFFMLALVL